MKSFKPMLAVDATDHLDTIRYPKYASYKLDGIRVIFHPQLGMVSRSLKPIQNKQIREKFEGVLQQAKNANAVIDGEFYGHELTFQEITRCVMTQDFTLDKSIKKIMKEKSFTCTSEYFEYTTKLLGQINFHCFEFHEIGLDNKFEHKQNLIRDMGWLNECVGTFQQLVHSKEDVKELFGKALDDGYEGLILRCPESQYKFGRSTLKEEGMLKVKPFETFDARIIEVLQATEVDPNAEKTTNELGRSVTSKKKDDRILIEKAYGFLVKYGEHQVKVVLSMSDVEKEIVWRKKESYIGRMIEYKGMLIGSKDVPRHPVMVRFREDRE